jgi:hypothetical protein
MLELTMEHGTRVPSLPDERDPGVSVWRDLEGEAIAYAQTVDGTAWVQVPGVASFAIEAGERVRAVPEPPATSELVLDVFGRTVLPIALQAGGRELLHASAVRLAQGVVAFSAVSETGKSTFAYGLGQRGHPVWADDAVCFDTAGPGTLAVPLPFAVRLRPGSAEFFEDRGEARSFDDGGREAVPLAALFVLERLGAGEGVECTRLSSAEAFPAALAHAYYLNTDDRERTSRMVAEYMELVVSVPVFKLAFEPGLDRLPTLFDLVERTVGDLEESAA